MGKDFTTRRAGLFRKKSGEERVSDEDKSEKEPEKKAVAEREVIGNVGAPKPTARPKKAPKQEEVEKAPLEIALREAGYDDALTGYILQVVARKSASAQSVEALIKNDIPQLVRSTAVGGGHTADPVIKASLMSSEEIEKLAGKLRGRQEELAQSKSKLVEPATKPRVEVAEYNAPKLSWSAAEQYGHTYKPSSRAMVATRTAFPQSFGAAKPVDPVPVPVAEVAPPPVVPEVVPAEAAQTVPAAPNNAPKQLVFHNIKDADALAQLKWKFKTGFNAEQEESGKAPRTTKKEKLLILASSLEALGHTVFVTDKVVLDFGKDFKGTNPSNAEVQNIFIVAGQAGIVRVVETPDQNLAGNGNDISVEVVKSIDITSERMVFGERQKSGANAGVFLDIVNPAKEVFAKEYAAYAAGGKNEQVAATISDKGFGGIRSLTSSSGIFKPAESISVKTSAAIPAPIASAPEVVQARVAPVAPKEIVVKVEPKKAVPVEKTGAENIQKLAQILHSKGEKNLHVIDNAIMVFDSNHISKDEPHTVYMVGPDNQTVHKVLAETYTRSYFEDANSKPTEVKALRPINGYVFSMDREDLDPPTKIQGRPISFSKDGKSFSEGGRFSTEDLSLTVSEFVVVVHRGGREFEAENQSKHRNSADPKVLAAAEQYEGLKGQRSEAAVSATSLASPQVVDSARIK